MSLLPELVTWSIPSPSSNGVKIGPVMIHYYALCLMTGIVAAWFIGRARWRARGGKDEPYELVLFPTVLLGILGARVYHVLTHLGDYVGAGRNPWTVFAIWQGGIAIYGAIGGGALAAWWLCRRHGVKFSSLADSVAPGIAVGQLLGRFGNWFNQELYGGPTSLPWGLEIDPAHRLPGYENFATFHPTFLYEAIWNLVVFSVLIWADRRWRLGRGKVFALYVALYTAGRFVTEGMRTDYSYDMFGPIRFNQAVAALLCVTAIGVLVWLVKNRPGREDSVTRDQPEAAAAQ